MNHDRGLTFFAEVRAEGLKSHHAKMLAQAGFTRLEIGLQSVNPETLKLVQRGGSARLVAEAARMLHDVGIELLVDLIIGLPGDTPADVDAGVDFLLAHGLGGEAQVFPLSLLPGTSMRTTAAQDGIEFDPAPPYRVRRSAGFSPGDLRASLLSAEDRLGRRLDELPRPHLVEHPREGGPRDVFFADLDEPDPAMLQRVGLLGAQHAALWLSGRDLFGTRDRVLAAVDARLRTDPHATLDVVLRATEPFPLDLLDALRARLAAATPSWQARALAHRGKDAMRRLCVVLPEGALLPTDWIDAVRVEVPLFRDQTLLAALQHAEDLGGMLPCARVLAPPDAPRALLEELGRRADGDSVGFADRVLEAQWTHAVLGYGDADR